MVVRVFLLNFNFFIFLLSCVFLSLYICKIFLLLCRKWSVFFLFLAPFLPKQYIFFFAAHPTSSEIRWASTFPRAQRIQIKITPRTRVSYRKTTETLHTDKQHFFVYWSGFFALLLAGKWAIMIKTKVVITTPIIMKLLLGIRRWVLNLYWIILNIVSFVLTFWGMANG